MHPNDARHSFQEEAEKVILPAKEYSDSVVRLQRDKAFPSAFPGFCNIPTASKARMPFSP